MCASAQVARGSEQVASASEQVAPEGRQQPAPAGLIAGRVVDGYNDHPIAGVTVSLQGVPLVSTDSQGRFAVPSVKPGNYTVLAVPPHGFGSATAFVELAPDQRITDVTMRVARLGSISGTVRDESGDPIVRMRVDVHVKRVAGLRPLLMPRGSVHTDDRGEFRIGNLPLGEYVVCACGREPLEIDRTLLPLMGSVPPSADAITQQLGSSVPVFPPTFPPAETRASAASAVVVIPPDENVRVHITIRSVTPRRVVGQLIGIGLTDLTKWALILLPENDKPEMHAITAINSARLAPTGAFEFVAVPPGRYALEAFQTTQNQDRWASMPIEVGEEDITGLVVPVTEGATVSGRLEFSGGTARPDAAALEKARVTLVEAELTPRAMIATGASGAVGHDGWVTSIGTFQITGIAPGRYLIQATRLGQEWQLTESVRSGPNAIVDRIVTVGLAGLTDVVITMTDTVSATILGTVTLDKYESRQTVRALLYPVEPVTWPEPFRFPDRFNIAPVGEGNSFKFNSVRPGEYFVTLVAQDAYIGPEQLEQWSRSATRVRLREGETARVEIRR